MKNDEKSKQALLAEIEELKARLRRLESQPGETSSPDWAAETHLFRIVAEAAPLGIAVAQGTRFVYVNSSLAGLVGLEPAELIGREFWEVVHPDDREMVRERGEARQRGINVPNSYKIRFVNAAGETRWVDYHGAVIRFQGEPAILGFAHDITEQIEADRRLEVSEEKYRTLVESAGEAIFSIDRNGIFLFMNREAARQLGGQPENFVGRNQREVFPKWLADRQMKQIRKVFETGQGFAEESTTFMQGKEHIHHTTGVPMRNSEGEITSMLGIARDVTELYETRTRLQKSEESYKHFIESLPVGVFQSTPAGKVLSGNPALARQCGHDSIEQYLAIPAEETWADPEQRREWVRLLEQKGTVNDYEVKLKRKDGAYIRVSVSAQGSFDEHNRLIRIDGVEIDVTARRKAEEALRRSGESMSALLHAPRNVMLMVDAKGTMLALNDAAAKEIGLSVEAALGTCAFDYMTEDIVRSWVKHLEEVFRTGQPVQFDERQGERFFESTLYPVFGDDRQVEAVVVSSIDVSETRRALDDLRESEELFRAVAETAPVIIVINQDGKSIYANPTAITEAGIDASELGKVNFSDFIHPDYRQMVIDIALARQRGETVPSKYEVKIVTRSGEERWALLSGSRIENRGKPATLGIAVDITERKLMEEALRKKTEQLKLALHAAQMGVWQHNLQSDVITTVHGSGPISGLPEKVYPRNRETLLALVHPEDRETLRQNVRQAAKNEAGFEAEFRLLLPDDIIRWVFARGIFSRDVEGSLILTGVDLDITVRKQMEERLRESEEKFRLITERSFDGIYHIDVDGVITYASPAAGRLAEYRPDDVIDRHISEFISERDLPTVERALATTATGQTVEGLQFGVIASDGHIVYVEVNATPIVHDERVVATQAIARDISDRRQAEKMLERAYEDQSRQLRQVAGGIAHDIYNDLFPVSAVVHKLRQRLDRPEDPDRERNLRLLQIMDGAVHRVIDLTETVSLYSKFQRESAGTITPVHEVVDQVLEHHKERLDQLDVKTLIEVPDVLRVACPERNLRSLLTNLLLNALDAMAGTRQPTLSIKACRTNGKVEITFGDNGSGIAPDVLPRVFDPFFSTKPNSGTGLGLAIAKRVVDVCAGKIKVDSTVDFGTTFHILLPGNVGT